MFPIAAIGVLGTRLSTYLASAVRSNPKLISQITAKLAKSGTQIASSATALVEYVTKSPLNATLVFGTLASMGISIVDVFSDPEQPEVQKHLVALQSSARTVDTGTAAYAAIADQSVSQELNVDVSAVRALEAQSRSAVKWAQDQFGDGRAAADAFDKLEYLAAIPSATRRYLLER